MFALPVIAISSHGVQNMFSNENAIVLDAESESLGANIAINMHKLITCGHNTLKKYAKKSRDDFISRYTADTMTKNYLNFVHNIIKY